MNNIVSKIKKIDYKERQIRHRENTNLHLDWLWWVIETSRGRGAFIFQTWFHTNPNWLHIKYYVYMLKTGIIVRTTLSCLPTNRTWEQTLISISWTRKNTMMKQMEASSNMFKFSHNYCYYVANSHTCWQELNYRRLENKNKTRKAKPKQ